MFAPTAIAAAAPQCVTTGSYSELSPSPGSPCWTEVDPYPFGFDGNPIDPSDPSQACQQFEVVVDANSPSACELTVDSMAFRSWNYGLAAVSANTQQTPNVTTYGVWLYNGERWFPDPTFPGQSTCQGDTVLWAGKLDYWLVGENPYTNSAVNGWPALCRFDGANYEWEELPIPKAALAQLPTTLNDAGEIVPVSGRISSGSCFAWNNCWFFGTYGIVLHWDGQVLTDATDGLGSSPWLSTDFTAGTVGTDASGNAFGVAVGASSDGVVIPPEPLTPLPSQPDGTAAPQVFESSGSGLSPTNFAPPTSGAGDQTDLAAVAFNSSGQGWVAGDPADYSVGNPQIPTVGGPGEAGGPYPSPVAPISESGTAVPCAQSPFTYEAGNLSPGSQWLWTSIGVLPDGDAVAGGQVNGDPVVEQVSCDSLTPASDSWCDAAPSPLALSPNTCGVILVDSGGTTTSVAVNASNDAWAATASAGGYPELYRLTDTDPPDAPAGNDDESRPNLVQPSPSIFVFAPPVVVSTPTASKTTTTRGRTTTEKLAAAVYDVRDRVRHLGGGRYSLDIVVKVRRPVTIGAEALRHNKVVSSSGLHHLRPPSGTLVLKLDPKRWPTRLLFVNPPAKK